MSERTPSIPEIAGTRRDTPRGMRAQGTRLAQVLGVLGRQGVTEVAVTAGRPPAVKVDGQYRPIGATPVADEWLRALCAEPALRDVVPAAGRATTTHRFDHGGALYDVQIVREGEAVRLRFCAARVSGSMPAVTSDAPVTPLLEDYRAVALTEEHTPAVDTGPPETLDTDPGAVTPGDGDDAGATLAAPPTTLPGASASPTRTVAPAVCAAANAPARFEGEDACARRDTLLAWARAANATDVHLTGGRPAAVRRVGRLEPVGQVLSRDDVEQCLRPLLNAELEWRLSSRGYVDLSVDLPSCGRLRVNVSRVGGGLKGCLRLITPQPPHLEELGLPDELRKLVAHHQGLGVVSGPNGHGKTTTLAALVHLINEESAHHIITVEDPVEVWHPIRKGVVSQREVGTHTESFHSALKAALREDPDVIIIGELRDRESVEMALEAAETGHFVIATMSTPSGARTIEALIDLFPPDDQPQVRNTLAGALKFIVSQRLVPTADGARLVAAAELITGSVPLWNLIRENKLYQLPSLQQRGRALGMIRLDDSLAALVRAGLVREEDAVPFAQSLREFKRATTGAPGSASASAPAATTAAPAGSDPAPAADGTATSVPADSPLRRSLSGRVNQLFARR